MAKKSVRNFVKEQIRRLEETKLAIVKKTDEGYSITYGLKTLNIKRDGDEEKLFEFLSVNNI